MNPNRSPGARRVYERGGRLWRFGLLLMVVFVVGCGEDERVSVASDPAVSSNGGTMAADGSVVAPTVSTPLSGLLGDLVWDVVVDGTEVCVTAESIELRLQLERNCIETSGDAAGFAGGAGTGRSDFPGVWVFVVLPDHELVEVTHDGTDLPYRWTNGAIAVLSQPLTESDAIRLVFTGALGTTTCRFDGAFLTCNLSLRTDDNG